ncbi:hypothetical protein PtrSN002B_000852 [Pyrenophora tritici-repentis]|uniref:Uncharacterized protein n=2 Tax=Pyrenophora tritici-repentis TaxID=45151 RepID=A0A2W1HYR2_9PLEO|nr:uncharacterized protein PTRG_05625 [Pyrenophora tritici-repentis Pt-1C-BFP]KAA8618692.1 hypothetical protein PtrV1_08121 [Pyrenophora tritici-repentis]EDU48545.1 conserved hypothetical protein [Pyrenophora tritici-repentis Pt-1C-BFP]KAF7449166.1 hypothetical protein A1F99_062150 [Pyrenophora tritici-repentis]KAF7570831.1 hypothetical protein PtrM4_108330 [Pyrenophora tritici-repentis]KAG9383893.1 hypothetical protein A1F94_005804 [Pyrenophora tritici-repentis]
MDKLKEKLHIGSSRRKSQPENDVGNVGTIEENRDSIDSELAAMPPHERVAYLKEFEDSDKHDQPKKGGLLEKLIARGNKKTEDQIAAETKEREAREAAHRDATHAAVGPGAGASAHSAAGPGGL